MPNYVTNIVRMKGTEKQCEEVLEFIGSDEQDVDFNKIIPMPESLNVTAGSMENQSIALYKSKVLGDHSELEKMLSYPWVKNANINTIEELQDYLIKLDPDILELGKTYITNIQMYGCSTWYDWCYKYWGTKWNACDSWADYDAFGFETAWSAVIELITTVSRIYPEVEFTYSYADEDFGSNLGKVVLKAGDIIDEYFPEEQTDAAYDFATEILGYDAREDWDEDE